MCNCYRKEAVQLFHFINWSLTSQLCILAHFPCQKKHLLFYCRSEQLIWRDYGWKCSRGFNKTSPMSFLWWLISTLRSALHFYPLKDAQHEKEFTVPSTNYGCITVRNSHACSFYRSTQQDIIWGDINRNVILLKEKNLVHSFWKKKPFGRALPSVPILETKLLNMHNSLNLTNISEN